MDSLQQTAEGTPCTRGQCVVASRVTPSMAHRQGSWRLSHVSRNLRLNDAVDWSSTRHRLGRGALSTAAFSVLCALHGAHAQVDTNRFCRDRNPDGYYDCGWLPTRIGAKTFDIPGPIQGVRDYTEGGAIGQYKNVIAANA